MLLQAMEYCLHEYANGILSVEISDCEKPTADSNDKLECHLSCSKLQSEKVEDEMDLISCKTDMLKNLSTYTCRNYVSRSLK